MTLNPNVSLKKSVKRTQMSQTPDPLCETNLPFKEQTNKLALSQLSSTHAVIQGTEDWQIKPIQLHHKQVHRRGKGLLTCQKTGNFLKYKLC